MADLFGTKIERGESLKDFMKRFRGNNPPIGGHQHGFSNASCETDNEARLAVFQLDPP